LEVNVNTLLVTTGAGIATKQWAIDRIIRTMIALRRSRISSTALGVKALSLR
jgi:hypothetical protein